MKETKDTFLLKEDGTEPLKIEAAQDYINELEAQVKLLDRSKGRLIETIKGYQGKEGFNLVAKDFLMNALTDSDVLDVLLEEIKESSIGDRVNNLEFDVRNMPDEYELTDTVVESEELENKVEELVKESLRNVTLRLEDV